MTRLSWIVPSWQAPAGVAALASTRLGGVSRGPYAGLNLGEHVGDAAEAVAENRRLITTSLPSEPLWLRQVHGTDVAIAEETSSGVCADAAIARTPNRVLAVMHADCLPVLLCDEDASVVAIAHAGWRGLASGVLEKTLQAMAVPSEKVMAWLGVAIGRDAFEVGDEVREAFCTSNAQAESAFSLNANGRWQCDLAGLAQLRLLQQGVRRITDVGLCAYADRRRFYSHRRDGRTGRLATLIWLCP